MSEHANITAAEHAISAHLGVQNVTINKGSHLPSHKPEAATETVAVSVAADTNDSALSMRLATELEEMARSIPEMRAYAFVETPEKNKERVRNALEQLRKDGVSLPENIGDLRIVDPKVGGAHVQGYMLETNHSDEFGDSLMIRVPKSEGKDNGAELAKLVKALNDGLEETKHVIAERSTMKYGLNEGDKAKLAELKYEITSNESDKHSEIYINIRHPKQIDLRNSKETPTAEKVAEAKAANVLNKLTEEPRGKLFGHAFLMKDKQIKPEFVPYLGTNNVKAMLRRAEKHYMDTHNDAPDASIIKRLHDLQQEELFIDPQQWNKTSAERHEWKHYIGAGVDPKHPGFVTLSITTKHGDADKVLDLLAKLPAKEADKSHHMAKVNSLKAIGGHPELAPLAGNQMEPNAADKKIVEALEPAQTNIHQKVEQTAHKPAEHTSMEHKPIELSDDHTKKVQEEIAYNRHAIAEIDAALASLPKPQMTVHSIRSNQASPTFAMGA
jgi:hypothetical protein